tara:strand:+ start:1052 stop:1750 length:699 start_codon:yes stop_codon:yes gene_type:complete
MLKYTIEASVIIVGILFSFYIEEIRSNNRDIEVKNELLSDLNRALERDLDQINEIQKMLNDSMQRISDLRNDINNNHDQLSDLEAVKKILNANVSTTFFSEDGVFTELVSSGSYELISNKELKNKLLEIYNHQKERNMSISDDIDILQNEFFLKFSQEFRVAINYNSYDGVFYGTTGVDSFIFDRDYYMSDNFYGYLTALQLNGYFYGRLLADIKNAYEATLLLSKEEITIR